MDCTTRRMDRPLKPATAVTPSHRGETAAEKKFCRCFCPEGPRVAGMDSLRLPPPGGIWNGAGLRGPPGGAASCVWGGFEGPVRGFEGF